MSTNNAESASSSERGQNIMLRNVLGDYLDKLDEREFDLPFLLLLPAMGFFDVHFVHGSFEFGKDFIAKKAQDNDEIIQYSFQSKAGDVGVSAWRGIQFQMFDAAINQITHPSFNTDLPHQPVLVLTGNLIGGARAGMQELNHRLHDTDVSLPIELWSKDALVDNLVEYGLTGLYRSSAVSIKNHAEFLSIYALALEGTLNARAIESHSRRWVHSSDVDPAHVARCAIESELISQLCVEHGHFYEAIMAKLALLRFAYSSVYSGQPALPIEGYEEAIKTVHALCRDFLQLIEQRWNGHEHLQEAIQFTPPAYLVQCSRIMEISALAYFTTSDKQTRSDCSALLKRLVQHENGCSHPIGDRYAISIILAALVLLNERETSAATCLLRDTVVWVCDRYEDGVGLAGIYDDEQKEVNTLFGYAFDFISVNESHESFLATALVDMLIFLRDRQLYSDAVNDFMATELHLGYWQVSDSLGACQIEGVDIVHIPSLKFSDELDEHMRIELSMQRIEPKSFQFVSAYGSASIVILMVLLRDRYFPSQWQLLAPDHRRVLE